MLKKRKVAKRKTTKRRVTKGKYFGEGFLKSVGSGMKKGAESSYAAAQRGKVAYEEAAERSRIGGIERRRKKTEVMSSKARLEEQRARTEIAKAARRRASRVKGKPSMLDTFFGSRRDSRRTLNR